ncbi:MAG: hypothetical protein R3A52_15965 [Polyangiales bacterium]
MIEADGCAGEPGSLTVQVFPSNSRFGAIELTAKSESLPEISPLTDLLDVFKAVTSKVLGAETKPETSLKVGLAFARGWHELDTSWRVAYDDDLRFTVTGELKLEARGSILGAVWKVPKEVRDCILDVGVLFTGAMPVSLTFQRRHRCFADAATAAIDESSGALDLKPKAYFGLYASAGSRKVLGVYAEGGVETQPSFNASLKYASPTLKASYKATWKPAVLKGKVLFKALIFSQSFESSIELFDEIESDGSITLLGPSP